MSRIGKKIISVPSNVEVKIQENKITVKGPRGELSKEFHEYMEIMQEKESLIVKRKVDSKKANQLHGLTRSLLYNMVHGVSEGFNKQLEIQGVGYRSQMDGSNLILNVGYSHPIKIEPPRDIQIKVNNNTEITVSGIDKEAVGHIASKIRSVRKPEPYKGKGIRYKNEYVIRKVGKAGKGK
uniref:ribosomal protein L6 n=1 Tax=Madagascaria erythrocladioides TaxID=753684 RepID=UPI001BF106D8|nr:ribosomal protein L6 [Madagascaria erythrocladioides]QUE29030.1 ribosomal protein L6 [Madagascaria erythrocladioides]UNJ16584.1 ribosomal protein L6 [Madagascaria erythrocladioides]